MSSELRVVLAAATLALWLALVLTGLIWSGRVHALWLVVLALVPWGSFAAARSGSAETDGPESGE